MRGTFALHVENGTQQALMKSVIKKDADIHTPNVTDPKPRPSRGSQQFRTGQALRSQLRTASQPALQNTPSTGRFHGATGKGWAGSVRGTEASQDTTSPLTINISSLWTLCRSPANLQVQNVKISQLCKMKKSRFFVFLSIWLFQRLTSKLFSTSRRTSSPPVCRYVRYVEMLTNSSTPEAGDLRKTAGTMRLSTVIRLWCFEWWSFHFYWRPLHSKSLYTHVAVTQQFYIFTTKPLLSFHSWLPIHRNAKVWRFLDSP